MNTWKITNTSNESVKIACKTSSMNSKGIILKPGESCLSESQLTASMDSQERRRFISVDREFDNSKLKLEYVVAYTDKYIKDLILEIDSTNKSDFEKAAEDAEKYIKKL
jgi:hypothetical protein